MKKSFGIITAAVLAAASLAACGGSQTAATQAAAETTQAAAETAAATTAGAAAEEASGESKAEETSAETAAEAESTAGAAELTEIVVGASPAPHAEILEAAAPLMEAKGYKLTIKEYTDYVQPNLALSTGDLDANYFQHLPYLENFNEENGTKLVSAAAIHYEPFGIYAGKTAALADLADGAVVAVPNDATNEARALLLLQDNGLITLADNVGLNATRTDITDNPKNLNIMEIEAAQVPRSLQDVDIAVINGNYAIEAGLKVADALAVEASDSLAAATYGNVVAVQEGREEEDAVKALVEVLTSDDIRSFIEDTYAGAVVPLF